MSDPESPGTPEDMRQQLAKLDGEDYLAYASLEQAQHEPDGAVILSGDYGGTIFLTAPVRLVRCNAEALVTLVSDLDAVTWMSGDPTIATVASGRHPIGTRVWGGDGGGVIVDGVWTHYGRLTPPVRAQAEEVVLGLRSRIDAALLRRERDTGLARKRTWRMRQAHLPKTCPGILTSHHPLSHSRTEPCARRRRLFSLNRQRR